MEFGSQKSPFLERKIKNWWNNYALYFKEMKKIKLFWRFFVHTSVLWHFHWSRSVLEYMSGFLAVLHRWRKYMNDVHPWNFQGNLQNRPTVVTDHTCTFILVRYDNRRAEKCWKRHATLPPDNAKNLEMLFSEIYAYFENSRGGGSPPLDPCLWKLSQEQCPCIRLRLGNLDNQFTFVS